MRAGKGGDIVTVKVSVTRGVNVTAPDIAILLGTITGRVLVNGVAKSGVTVDIQKNAVIVTRQTTDGQGRYNFTGLVAGPVPGARYL